MKASDKPASITAVPSIADERLLRIIAMAAIRGLTRTHPAPEEFRAAFRQALGEAFQAAPPPPGYEEFIRQWMAWLEPASTGAAPAASKRH